MNTHYIYNKKSGAIVHIHISEPGQDISRKGILMKVDQSIKRSQLDIISTEALAEGPIKIDVKEKRVVQSNPRKKSSVSFGFSEETFIQVKTSKAKKIIYKALS